MALAVVAIGARGASAQGVDDFVVGAPVTPFVAAPVEPGPTTATGPEEPYPEGGPEPVGPIPAPSPVDDGIVQVDGADDTLLLEIAPPDALSSPIVNVAGVTANAFPPDTVHDVGPNHVVQMTNNTGFIVYDKQGNPIGGATPNAAIRLMSALWPVGDVCAQDDTDPIVVYDHLADRWLMAQVIRDPGAPGGGAFNPPGPALCIAVSTSPDPTSTWFAYSFDTTDLAGIFPDYEKIGVWPDGYYMSSFESTNLGIFVFDRANMLAGAAAGFLKTTISALTPSAGVRNTRILPADLDGPPPPAGTPNFFVRTVDGQQDTGNPTDRIEVYEAVTDFSVPSLAFTLVDTLTPAPFQIMVCNRNGGGSRDCVPEPIANASVDALSNRPMMQLKYREFGTHASMVFNQTIDVSGSIPFATGIAPTNEVAGIRWYELRKSGANWAIEQQGTYAPQPIGATAENQLLHRWMGSIAMDRFGSIALGYSIVNADTANPIHPGISYTGRRHDDLPGLLPQIEQSILVGGNSQTGLGGRWGDYSAMTVDPVDDCTFWYTQHVTTQTGNNKPTQIASFAFNECAVDLSIAKTDSPDPVLAGTQLTYSITVTNNGPLDATNLVVTDTLPVGVSYVADSLPNPECNDTTGPIVCNLGDLAAGDSTSFTITVAVDSDILFVPDGPTEIENTASVAVDQNDSDNSNNEVIEVTLVNESADLAVTKICKPDVPALAGTTATCEIFVDNLGPSGARNVTLTDVHLSVGTFSIGSFSASQGACNGPPPDGTVDCELGDIDAGERVTITVDLTSDEGGDVNDVATVSSPTPDPSTANNQAQGTVSFQAKADLAVIKSDAPDPVVAGEQITFTLTVTNNGPSAAVNVLIEDNLPAGVTVDSVSATGGGACNAGVPGNALQPTTCTFDTLANGDSEIMTIVVTVLENVADGTILNNDASVSSDVQDTNNANDLASTDTTVQAKADLTVVKSDSPDPVLAGGLLSYIIQVTNNGPSAAVAVALTDTLPAEVGLVSATANNGGPCVEVQPGVVQCTLGNLAVGETVTVTITVKVDPSVPNGTTIMDIAEVTAPTADPVPGNNVVAEDTLVNTAADLWIDKTSNFPTGNASGTIIYFLTVHNVGGCSEDDPQVCGSGGPSDAQNIVVVDTLPSTSKKLVVEFVSEKCVYNKGPHQVVCDEPVLAVGDSVTFQIQARAKGNLGEIINKVDVTTTTTDPVSANDHDELLLTVQGGTGDRGGPGGGRGRGGGPKN